MADEANLERWDPKRFFAYLKEAEDRGEKFALLVGAGASRSSGILTGAELVQEWVPRFARQHGIDADQADEWAKTNVEGYDPENPGGSYSLVVDRLFPTPAARRIEIDRLCRGRNPGFGYGVLSSLVARESHAFNIALTTNFDDLLTDALYVFQGDHPLVISEDRLADYIDPSSTQTLIVKLHGAYQLRPRNTEAEIAKLDSVMHERVGNLLLGRGLIVIGYGGHDRSVEALLRGLPDSALPSGIWWTGSSPPTSSICEWLRERSAIWVEAGDFDALMFEAFAAFEFDPPNPNRVSSIFNAWETSYQKLSERPVSAEASFEQARRELARRPDHSWGSDLAALASVLAERDPDARDSLYQEGIERFPRSARLLGSYAVFLNRERKDVDAAEAMFKRAVEADPEHAQNLGNYAVLLDNEREDFDAAEAMYRRAVEADPDDARHLGNYAHFLETDRKDADAAEAMFKRALEADPEHADSLGNYALFLADERKDVDGAEEMYKRALEADPQDVHHLANYATFLKDKRNDLDAAEEMYKRALKADPEYARNLANYAVFLLIERKDLGRAEEMFKRALEADPEHANSLGNYALLEFSRDRIAHANELVDRALALVDDETLPPLAAELQLYRWAAGDPTQRAAARAECLRLIETGARSPGWDFEPVLAIARRQGRDDLAELERAAEAIAGTE